MGYAGAAETSAHGSQVIRVDFASGRAHRLRPGQQGARIIPGSGLALIWLINGLAAITALLWALGTGAVPFFLAGAIAGLVAHGSAVLVTVCPPRTGVRAMAASDEVLAGTTIVSLAIGIVSSFLGAFAVLASAV